MRPRSLALLAPCLSAVAACSALFDLSDLAPTDSGDAQADAAGDATPDTRPADDSFTLTATPTHVTQDPGDSTDLAVTIARGSSFTDIVDVTVNDVGGLSGVQTSPATLTFLASAPLMLHLDVAASAKTPQDGTITLLGIARGSMKSATTSFGVRIGSALLDTTVNAAFVVPSFAQVVLIKAWGAGGGIGGSLSDTMNQSYPGGQGGGGGMASAWFAVKPGETLTVVAGTAGASANNGGGGGGGYSAVLRGADELIVAGAGGGGGGASETTDVYCSVSNGRPGGAGGGGAAEAKLNAATKTMAGAAGGPNASPGGARQGGDGADGSKGSKIAGGTPGGGAGNYIGYCAGAHGGGGGGGGWLGGGGGGESVDLSTTAAGGGGSGYVSDAGTDATAFAGNGAGAAAMSDPDYRAGTATGATSLAKANVATPGHVVIRAAKP